MNKHGQIKKTSQEEEKIIINGYSRLGSVVSVVNLFGYNPKTVRWVLKKNNIETAKIGRNRRGPVAKKTVFNRMFVKNS